MLDLTSLLYGVLVPGFLTGIGLVCIWRPPLRPGAGSGEGPRTSLFALLCGVAFFTAYSLSMELPPTPFGSRQLAGLDWLIWFALLAAPLFVWEGGKRAFWLRLPAAGFMLAFSLRAMVVHHWEGAEAWVWMVSLLVGLLLLQTVSRSLGAQVQRATMPLVLLVVGSGLALTIGWNGSARLGQVTGIVCACLGAAMLLGFWHARFRLLSGDVDYVVFLLFGLGACAYFFSDLPPLDSWLFASAPLVARLVESRTRSLPAARRTLAITLASAAPVVVACVRAYLTFQATSSADGYYDY